jgi:hypothetical protein
MPSSASCSGSSIPAPSCSASAPSLGHGCFRHLRLSSSLQHTSDPQNRHPESEGAAHLQALANHESHRAIRTLDIIVTGASWIHLYDRNIEGGMAVARYARTCLEPVTLMWTSQRISVQCRASGATPQKPDAFRSRWLLDGFEAEIWVPAACTHVRSLCSRCGHRTGRAEPRRERRTVPPQRSHHSHWFSERDMYPLTSTVVSFEPQKLLALLGRLHYLAEFLKNSNRNS